MPPSSKNLFLVLALGSLFSSCVGTRNAVDPTVLIRTQGGQELGVSTTYGLVFLGRSASSGYIELEVRFGDGPSTESTVIEPIGGGLFTAETEIRLPAVPLRFREPAAGELVLLQGRTEEGAWEARVEVLDDPRVQGLLVAVPSNMPARQDQVGAGVYWVNPADENDHRLLGLVTAFVHLDDRRYLAVAGPRELWRLVTHRRDHLQRRPWVYREDIL